MTPRPPPGVDWRRWTVAITGMNSRPDSPGPGMAVARCLREAPEFQGRIIGVGYEALDAGMHHQGLCDAGYLLPYPSEGGEALAERLGEICARERINAIVPCLDAELPTFIEAIPQLADAAGVRCLLPNRRQLRDRAKDRLPELAAALGIAVPETRPLSDPGFFDRAEAEGWDFPLVVKGVFYDAIVVHRPAEAKAAFAEMAAKWGYPVLVQRFLLGHEVNLAAVGDGRGGLLGSVMMRKHAVTDKGKAWAGITILDDALLGLAETLVRELAWPGPLEVEVLCGPDGARHLIEINPRFPAWIYLSHGAGRNLPVQFLRLLAGEAPAALPPAEPGTMFLRHAEDLIIPLARLEAMLTTGEWPPLHHAA